MLKSTLLFVALLLLVTSSAFADEITYQVTVNTTSITGTAGSLDFQFDPGPFTSQAANLQIQAFTSDGTLGSAALIGDVSGILPATLSFDNAGFFNDYFTGFTYGSSISFLVHLFGPALTSPDGTSTSGSSFAFSMFSDGAGTAPVLTNDSLNGFAVTVNINLDGTTTLTDFSSQTNATPVTSVHEPGTLLLIGSGLACLLLLRKRATAVLHT